jgi:hypothetical protein
MVSFKLYDTGYGSHSTTGTPLSLLNRAGTNTTQTAVLPFDINVEGERVDGGGSVMDDKEIKIDGSLSSVSPITFGNPIFVLNCSVSRRSIPRTFLYSWFYQLMRMERTKSVKILALQSEANVPVYSSSSTNLGNTTNLVDNNALFADDEWIGYNLKITSGANAGLTRAITDNTQTIIVTAAFPNAIQPGISYEIYDATANDYVPDSLPLLTELYGMSYLGSAFQATAATLTGRASGSIPLLAGYVKSVGNFSTNSNNDKLSFSITFEVID